MFFVPRSRSTTTRSSSRTVDDLQDNGDSIFPTETQFSATGGAAPSSRSSKVVRVVRHQDGRTKTRCSWKTTMQRLGVSARTLGLCLCTSAHSSCRPLFNSPPFLRRIGARSSTKKSASRFGVDDDLRCRVPKPRAQILGWCTSRGEKKVGTCTTTKDARRGVSERVQLKGQDIFFGRDLLIPFCFHQRDLL